MFVVTVVVYNVTANTAVTVVLLLLLFTLSLLKLLLLLLLFAVATVVHSVTNFVIAAAATSFFRYCSHFTANAVTAAFITTNAAIVVATAAVFVLINCDCLS